MGVYTMIRLNSREDDNNPTLWEKNEHGGEVLWTDSSVFRWDHIQIKGYSSDDNMESFYVGDFMPDDFKNGTYSCRDGVFVVDAGILVSAIGRNQLEKEGITEELFRSSYDVRFTPAQ